MCFCQKKILCKNILKEKAKNKLHDVIAEKIFYRIAYHLSIQELLIPGKSHKHGLSVPSVYKDFFGYIIKC